MLGLRLPSRTWWRLDLDIELGLLLPSRRWRPALDRCSSPNLALFPAVVVVVAGFDGGTNGGPATAAAVCAATMSAADITVDCGAAGHTEGLSAFDVEEDSLGSARDEEDSLGSALDEEEDSLGWEGGNMEPRKLLLLFLWWPPPPPWAGMLLLSLWWPDARLLVLRPWLVGMLLLLASVVNIDLRESCLFAPAGTRARGTITQNQHHMLGREFCSKGRGGKAEMVHASSISKRLLADRTGGNRSHTFASSSLRLSPGSQQMAYRWAGGPCTSN